jgi:hypothetical protein
MPTRAQLESQVKELKENVKSVEADCSILLKENIKLIELCEKHVPGFTDKDLYTAQWRSQYEAEKTDNDG